MGGQTNVVAYALFSTFTLLYVCMEMGLFHPLLCATKLRVHDSMLSFSFTEYMCNLSVQVTGFILKIANR